MEMIDKRTPPDHGPRMDVTNLVKVPIQDDGSYSYLTAAAELLAAMSGWSYSDEDTFRRVMGRLGLGDAATRYVAVRNDAMLVDAGAFYVEYDRLGVLCFRGTELRNVINWLADATTELVDFEPIGKVHGGFYRNLQALWPQLVERMMDKGGGGIDALYITGHSLGGAMAALAAMTVWHDPELVQLRSKLRGVYTFGQPMVMTADCAKECDAHVLGKIVFRHVFDKDIVPRLPPRTAGHFAHFGRELVPIEDHTGWRFRSEAASQAITAALSVPIGIAAWMFHQSPVLRHLRLPFSWDDHSPVHYIHASTQRRVIAGIGLRDGRVGRARVLPAGLDGGTREATTPAS